MIKKHIYRSWLDYECGRFLCAFMFGPLFLFLTALCLLIVRKINNCSEEVSSLEQCTTDVEENSKDQEEDSKIAVGISFGIALINMLPRLLILILTLRFKVNVFSTPRIVYAIRVLRIVAAIIYVISLFPTTFLIVFLIGHIPDIPDGVGAFVSIFASVFFCAGIFSQLIHVVLYFLRGMFNISLFDRLILSNFK